VHCLPNVRDAHGRKLLFRPKSAHVRQSEGSDKQWYDVESSSPPLVRTDIRRAKTLFMEMFVTVFQSLVIVLICMRQQRVSALCVTA
jgi:hypothetical protein